MRTRGFGTPMAARRTGLDLPLPLQFLAAWRAVWLIRVLQAQVEHTKHYHEERNHQGLDNELVDGSHQDAAGTGAVVCRERLGGLLDFYHREAA